MSQFLTVLTLEDPEATRRFAAQMARGLVPGDTLLLEGDIGAGKTHFARSLIQSIQDMPEDVPSPTYTLMQTYETARGEVVHADLYRLSGPDEVAELGLLDAFGSQICLVEWPDRLGDEAPTTALTIRFETGRALHHRRVTVSGRNDLWTARLDGMADV